MTRISAGIRAKELCDAHVIKERIEVLRVPNNIKNGIAVINFNKIPKEFKLGTGHVKFFENKLKYVFNRYNELTEEVKRRGFVVTDYSSAFDDLPKELWNDYVEQPNDRVIVRERIIERLNTMKNIKYYSTDCSVEELIKKMQ